MSLVLKASLGVPKSHVARVWMDERVCDLSAAARGSRLLRLYRTFNLSFGRAEQGTLKKGVLQLRSSDCSRRFNTPVMVLLGTDVSHNAAVFTGSNLCSRHVSRIARGLEEAARNQQQVFQAQMELMDNVRSQHQAKPQTFFQL